MVNQSFSTIGMMSGTSLDGLDIAHVVFTYEQAKWSFEIVDATTVAMPEDLAQRIARAKSCSAFDLVLLDRDLGRWFGNSLSEFIAEKPSNFLFAASHGQTIFHLPDQNISVQIGDPNIIAARAALPVIADFRRMDIALGGQGAPLAPIGDELLFAEYDACVNLGGFINISFEQHGSRKAFDCAPFNTVLNRLAESLGKPFDDGGQLAKSGTCLPHLLHAWDSLNFYSQSGPKSLGTEWLEECFMPLIPQDENPRNVMNTFVHHVAQQLIQVVPGQGSVLLTGGGTYHDYFVEILRAKAPHVSWCIPSKDIIEFKEAVIFAFLGLLRWLAKENALKSVTGATRNSCGGGIYWNP